MKTAFALSFYLSLLFILNNGLKLNKKDINSINDRILKEEINKNHEKKNKLMQVEYEMTNKEQKNTAHDRPLTAIKPSVRRIQSTFYDKSSNNKEKVKFSFLLKNTRLRSKNGINMKLQSNRNDQSPYTHKQIFNTFQKPIESTYSSPIPVYSHYNIPIIHHVPIKKIVKKYIPIYYPIPIEHRINIPVRVPIKIPQRILIPEAVPYGVKVPVPFPVKVEVPQIKEYKIPIYEHIPIYHHFAIIDNDQHSYNNSACSSQTSDQNSNNNKSFTDISQVESTDSIKDDSNRQQQSTITENAKQPNKGYTHEIPLQNKIQLLLNQTSTSDAYKNTLKINRQNSSADYKNVTQIDNDSKYQIDSEYQGDLTQNLPDIRELNRKLDSFLSDLHQ